MLDWILQNEIEEGVWVSVDGDIVWIGGPNGTTQNGSFTNWYNNLEPNNSGGEDCALIYPTDDYHHAAWNDKSYSTNLKHILEIELYKSNFTSNQQSLIGSPISFENLSSPNATAWEWDFNSDGNTDSTEENPTWVYSQIGNYDVTLTTWWGEEWSTEIKENYISIVAPLDYGLVAYYPFNGNANDESGNGNHGQVNGATLTIDRFGNINSAYEFSEYLQTIKLPKSVLDGMNDFSISLWMSTSSNHAGIISGANNSDDNEFVHYIDYGKLMPHIKNSAFLDDTIINDNTCRNIVLVRDGQTGELIIYIDGSVHNSYYLLTGALDISNNGLWIGNDQDAVGGNWEEIQQFIGTIDDIRVYNRQLSYQEILALYNEDQQNSVSVLSGQVTDNEGNHIPQASISLTASNTNLEVISNEDGYYTFSALTNNQVNLYVSKEGYQSESRTMSLESGFNSANFTLTEVSTGVITSLELSDDLTIYADSIEETIWDLYSLSGNVNINGILEIDGVVTVDKRDIYTRPLVHFTEGAYGIDIDGVDVEILPETPLMYTVEGPDLVPESLAYFCGCQWTIGGYSTEVGRLRFGNTAHYGDYVEVMMIIKPASKNFFERLLKDSNWVDSNDSPDLFIPKLEGATAKTYFSRNQGIEQACDISGLTCNFGAFSVEDFSLWLNPEDDLLGGSLEIRIPGFGDFASVRDENNMSLDTKVVLIDNNANTSVETNLETLIRIQERGLFKYLQVGGMLEFVSGNLNSIAISVSGMDIPLFNTGTFIREN